jgi:hypothetical protein
VVGTGPVEAVLYLKRMCSDPGPPLARDTVLVVLVLPLGLEYYCHDHLRVLEIVLAAGIETVADFGPGIGFAGPGLALETGTVELVFVPETGLVFAGLVDLAGTVLAVLYSELVLHTDCCSLVSHPVVVVEIEGGSEAAFVADEVVVAVEQSSCSGPIALKLEKHSWILDGVIAENQDTHPVATAVAAVAAAVDVPGTADNSPDVAE